MHFTNIYTKFDFITYLFIAIFYSNALINPNYSTAGYYSFNSENNSKISLELIERTIFNINFKIDFKSLKENTISNLIELCLEEITESNAKEHFLNRITLITYANHNKIQFTKNEIESYRKIMSNPLILLNNEDFENIYFKKSFALDFRLPIINPMFKNLELTLNSSMEFNHFRKIIQFLDIETQLLIPFNAIEKENSIKDINENHKQKQKYSFLASESNQNSLFFKRKDLSDFFIDPKQVIHEDLKKNYFSSFDNKAKAIEFILKCHHPIDHFKNGKKLISHLLFKKEEVESKHDLNQLNRGLLKISRFYTEKSKSLQNFINFK